MLWSPPTVIFRLCLQSPLMCGLSPVYLTCSGSACVQLDSNWTVADSVPSHFPAVYVKLTSGRLTAASANTDLRHAHAVLYWLIGRWVVLLVGIESLVAFWQQLRDTSEGLCIEDYFGSFNDDIHSIRGVITMEIYFFHIPLAIIETMKERKHWGYLPSTTTTLLLLHHITNKELQISIQLVYLPTEPRNICIFCLLRAKYDHNGHLRFAINA